MTNSFSSFEYEKVPDYTAQLDRRFKEEAEGEKLVEAQIRDNNRMREKAAGQNAKTWKALAELVPKAADTFSKYAQAQDEKYEARLSVLLNRSGFSFEEYAKYNEDDQDNLKMDQLGIDMANEQIRLSELPGADVGHHLTLADEWRSLSGRDIKRIGGLTLMREANQLDNKFELVKDQLQLEDGTKWSNANPAQKEDLWDEFLVQHGVKGVLPFKDIFREKAFWETANQKRDAILRGENYKYKQSKIAERQSNHKEFIFEAAQTSNPLNLYESINEAVNGTWGDYNSANKVLGKQAAAKHYVGQLEEEIKAGNLPPSAYSSLINLKVPHKDGRGEVTYGSILDRQVGYSTKDKLIELQNAHIQNKLDDKDDEGTAMAFQVQGLIDAAGGQLHEAEARELEKRWKTKFGASQPVPENLKYQLANSVQDYDDRVLAEEVRQAIKDPLITADKNRALLIQDETLRSEVLNEIEADRIKLTKTQLNDVEGSFTKIVKGKLNLDLGESGNTIEAEEMTTYAVHNYLKYYNEGRNQYDSHEAIHEKAYQRVKEEIESGVLYKDPRSIDTSKAYSKKMESIRSWRTKNPEKFLTKGLLPNTSEDFKQLEKWAANPRANNFPGLYRELAVRYPAYTVLPGSGIRRRLTGYEWAQIQYKTMTGRELPPITGRVKEVINNPNWGSFLNTPNLRTQQQGEALDNNSINDEANLTPGVTV